MAYKVLGQVAPGAASESAVYTVPASKAGVVSSLVVANRSSTPTTFRIRVAVAGAGAANEQYLAYDAPIGANEIITFTLGITLATTDVLYGYNTLATVSFNAFGSEVAA